MTKTFLKIKIKSLAEEARIIKQEERKWGGRHIMRRDLHEHRVNVVRKEIRASLLVYGFLRGRSYNRVEGKCHDSPDWKRVAAILKKFCEEDERVWKQRFAEWIDEATLLHETFRPHWVVFK